jgi:serine/threonine protein phosphatase PrpC
MPLPPPAPGWVSASCSHPGRVRRVNEDSCLDRPDLGLWIVADGVGGERAGDRASGLIVETLGQLGTPTSGAAFLTQVRDGLRNVNLMLRAEALASGDDRLIASTVVALLVFGQHYACAWAGDSRLYLFRNNRLRQISRDHSEVQEMVDAGLIAPEEARRHPRGNIVTRAVGARDNLVLEMVQDQLRPNDVFLLCSDGLTKELEDDEIAAMLAERPVNEAVDALIGAALERGARDNVTVIVMRAGAVAES